VLVEDAGDAIVLAFRGTKNIRDWLIDADFLLTEIPYSAIRTSRMTRASAVHLAADCQAHSIASSLSPQRGEGARVRGENYTSVSILRSDNRHSAPVIPQLKVHRGFLRAIISLLPKIMRWLDGAQAGRVAKPLLLTGHSLGGALATMAAYFLQQRGYPIGAVYTFASPRVGNGAWRDAYNSAGLARTDLFSPDDPHPVSLCEPTLSRSRGRGNFARHSLRVKTFRLAAAGDLVPLVPGLLDGYRHVGVEVFLKWEHSTFNIQHRTSNVQNVSRETRKTASGSAFAKATARGDTRPPGIIQINPSHVWEFLCDEVRAARALRRFDLDFILQFHSLQEDYLPLLDKGLLTANGRPPSAVLLRRTGQ